MKLFFFFVVALTSGCLIATAQNNALILNNAVVVNITGGAVLSVNQSNAAGIIVNGTGTGYIQSEGETNRVAWHINDGTGDHVIPFGVASTGTKIDMHYNITGAGSASGTLVASTFATANNNTVYPSVYAPVVTTMDSTGFGASSINHSLYVVDRFWVLRDLSNPWATKPTSNLTLTYRDQEWAPANTITEANLLAQYWNNTQWNPGWYTGSPLLGVNNAAANQVNSINAGSGNLYTWILVDRVHPLPVVLTRFDASCSENTKPVISWSTASETNNAFFTLLRSTDGISWTTVTTISGAGNSNTPLAYFFTDENAPEGTLYYNLTQTDFNGTINDAGIVTINCNAVNPTTGSFDMNVYSDNEHQIHVTFVSQASEPMVMRLFDMRGRLVHQQTFNPAEGLNHFILDMVPLQDAAYMFNLTGSGMSENRKFFLQ